MHHLCQKIREIELLVLKAEPVVAAFSVHSVQVLTLANKVNIFSHTNWGCLSLLASSLYFLTGNDFHLWENFCPCVCVQKLKNRNRKIICVKKFVKLKTRYAYYCNDVSIFFSDKLHRSSLTRPPPSNIPNTHHDGSSSRHNLRLVTPFKNYVNGEWSSTWRSSSSQQGDELQ